MYESPQDIHNYGHGSPSIQIEPLRRPTPSFGVREKTYTSSFTDSIYKPYRPEYATPDLGKELMMGEGMGREETVCGLRRRFWIIFGVVCLLGAGAIGAGLGVGLSRHTEESKSSTIPVSAAQESTTPQIITTTITASPIPTTTSSTSSSSSTITSTSTSSTPFPTSGTLTLNCPSIDNTHHTSPSSTITYELHCSGLNYIVSTPAIEGYNTTTIEACMDKCTWFNTGGPRTACVGITFQGNLTEAEKPAQMANCWLASSTTGAKSGTGSLVASAEIVG